MSNQLTSLQQAIHANHSVMQAIEKGQTMKDIYGLTLKRPLAFYDQDLLSWKMYEATLDLGLEMCSATLPTSGITHDGLLYELPMSELPIDESDYSSLPTPMARDYKGAAGRDMDLTKTLLNIPTPTAADAHWSETLAERSGIKGNHNLSLTSWARKSITKQYRLHWIKVN